MEGMGPSGSGNVDFAHHETGEGSVMDKNFFQQDPNSNQPPRSSSLLKQVADLNVRDAYMTGHNTHHTPKRMRNKNMIRDPLT